MPQSRKPFRAQKRQSRLEFQSLPETSLDKNAYSTAVQDRLANVRYQGGNPKRMTRSGRTDETIKLLTPEPSSQPEQDRLAGSLPPSSPPNPSPREPTDPTSNEKDHEEEDEDDLILPSAKRRRTQSLAHKDEFETPTRRSSRRNVRATQANSLTPPISSDKLPIHTPLPLEGIGSAETSGDEEDTMVTQPTSRHRASRPQRDDPFIVDDNDVRYVSSDGEPASKLKRVRPKAQAADFVVDDDEVEYLTSSDDAPITSSKKKRRSSKTKHRSRQEQDEIDDDLRDLQDSEQEDSTRRKRTRGGPVNSERERTREHFNLLRQRRAGQKTTRVLDSDEEDELADDAHSVDIEEIVRTASSEDSIPNDNELQTSTDEEQERDQERDMLDDEDDFVVEDQNSRPLGRPHPDMPLAFTSYASRKPKELFVHVVEWLVKNKIAPAFSRDDELYRLSWDRVNDQIKAQAGSRLISSAWNSDFKNAILARPKVEVTLVGELEDESFQNCDACNRTNHPARYEFRFTGDAYHQETLEPIEISDDEADDRDDAVSYDQAGHVLPSQSTLFYLGRFCAANAEMGHKLTHWKFHLNESLLEYLEEQGVLSASSIVARDKLNKKKREREAESIVDSMEATGEIARLWQELQDDLEDARFGMEGHEAKGGRRTAARIGKVRVNKGNGRIEQWSEGGRKQVILQSDSEGE